MPSQLSLSLNDDVPAISNGDFRFVVYLLVISLQCIFHIRIAYPVPSSNADRLASCIMDVSAADLDNISNYDSDHDISTEGTRATQDLSSLATSNGTSRPSNEESNKFQSAISAWRSKETVAHGSD